MADPNHNLPFAGAADPVAAATHVLGMVATGAACVPLWRLTAGQPSRRITIAVYAVSTFLLYFASTAYHVSAFDAPHRPALRRLDHAMIYVLIAGTYTPIVAHMTRDPLRWIVLGFVWTVALSGVVMKLFFFGSIPEWLDVALYVGLGWFAVVPFRAIVRACSLKDALLLPLAGVLYTAGALSELFGWPVLIPRVLGFHELFHVLVLAASACFYVFMIKHVIPLRVRPLS